MIGGMKTLPYTRLMSKNSIISLSAIPFIMVLGLANGVLISDGSKRNFHRIR